MRGQKFRVSPHRKQEQPQDLRAIFNYLRNTNSLVMREETQKRFLNFEMVKQNLRRACVFRRNNINRRQNLHCSIRNIVKVTYRGWNNVQRSGANFFWHRPIYPNRERNGNQR